MPIPLPLLQRLYFHQHQSMSEIAHTLNCSIHKVEYWMSKYQMPRRNRSSANYHKYNPLGDPFHVKRTLSLQESNLLHLSLGLFWGEGNKVAHEGLRIGNSDPQLLKQWCLFLRNICQIKESKIHFHLQTFRDNDIDVARVYWAQQLDINPQRITSGKPTKSLGKGIYTKINPHGVMTVGVYNIKLRQWMIAQLQKLGYNPNV